MPYYHDREDGDLDESEYPEPDSEDDVGTAPCPTCGKTKFEDCERCPHCGNYASEEDAPYRKPPWLVIGAIVGLAIVLWWVMSLQN